MKWYKELHGQGYLEQYNVTTGLSYITIMFLVSVSTKC